MPRLPRLFAVSSRLSRAAPLALYVALAIGSTWPLARDLGEVIPAGQERAATVPLASAWALWWTSDRIGDGLSDYWDAPIMQPADDVFAFSEPMPLLGAAAAPVLWLGGSLALAHGLVLLLCLVLNGIAIERLARRLTAGAAGAITAGAIGVLLPYVHFHLGVLSLVPVFALAWCIHASIDLARDPRWWRGLVLGGAVSTSYLLCAQHTLFLVLAAAPCAAWLLGRQSPRRLAFAALPAVAVVAVVVAPIALHQRGVSEEHELRRGSNTIRKGSASLSTYARAPFPALLPLPPVWHQQKRTAAFPGLWKLLAALAAGLLLLRQRRSQELRFVASIAAAAFLLSVLPRLEVAWFEPWRWLRAVVPGLDQIRSVHRFAVLVHLVIAIFAGLCVHYLATVWARAERRRLVAIACLALLCVIELWPRGQNFVGPPSRRDYAATLAWLALHTDDRDLIAHIPLPGGSAVEDFEPSARAMYLQTYHHRRLANGYSSYWSASYRQTRRGYVDLMRGRADTGFRAGGVRFVIAHEHALEQRGHALRPALGWSLVFRDPGASISIYRLP